MTYRLRHIVDRQLLAIYTEVIDMASLPARANRPADLPLRLVHVGERFLLHPPVAERRVGFQFATPPGPPVLVGWRLEAGRIIWTSRTTIWVTSNVEVSSW